MELADRLADTPDSIDVLIGSDYYWQIVTGETVRGTEGPVAVSSSLGWLLSGPVSRPSSKKQGTVSNLAISQGNCEVFSENTEDELLNTLKSFWKTESISIDDNQDAVEPTPEHFLSDIKFNESRYEVGLPLNGNQSTLPTNYNQSFNQLKSLQRHLIKEPELASEYDNIIQEQLNTNIIERVPEDGAIAENAVHYLPHHPVVRKDRATTKVRIVYNGSAKQGDGSLSLNDCLQKGPNLIPKLYEILLWFRWNPVALTADIEKAFLMVGIPKYDRDLLRFLWLKNPNDANSTIEQFRFTRLVFGLRSSPTVLGAVISHHLTLHKESHPEVVDLIEKSLYVDDLISGEDNDDSAFHVYEVSKKVMSSGGFNLRKWNTNSEPLLRRIHDAEANVENRSSTTSNNSQSRSAILLEEDESYAKATIGSAVRELDQSTTKVLGIDWNCKTDNLEFNSIDILKYAQQLPCSKRSILKVTARLFDP